MSTLARTRAFSPSLTAVVATLSLLFCAAAPAQITAGEGDDEVSLEELERLAKGGGASSYDQKLQRKIEMLKTTYGDDYWTFLHGDPVPKPYLIAAQMRDNVDEDTLAKEYGDIFGNLYKVFYANFGDLLDLQDITEPVVVLVYDSKDAYKEMRENRPDLALPNEQFMAGYYMPGTGILTQWRQGNLWEVMFHEGTHQLMDFATRKWNVPQGNRAPWFSEGFADFMGGHDSKLEYSEEEKGFVRSFKLGQFLKHRYSDMQTGMLTGDAPSLKDLVHLGFWEFKNAQNNQEGNGRNQQITNYTYSMGWALCMFLNYYEDGRYKDQFEEYMQHEVRGEGSGEKFAEIFYLEVDEDWEDFQAEFRSYVFRGLRQMGLKHGRK